MQLSGNIFDYFIVFWSGVLVSFTPCVYPVLPVVAAFIAGVNTRGTKWMGFIISLVYVFGLAMTYSLFGVIAALSGSVFGQIQSQPIFYVLAANVLVLFALIMVDVIPFQVSLLNVQRRMRSKSIFAVLLFGIASGLVVGPCTAPVLGTLLLYVSSKQNILHAVSLLFVFSYGVGASLILVGTFSGLLSRLPKSGPWLMRVKQFAAIVLIIVAEHLLIKAGIFLYG